MPDIKILVKGGCRGADTDLVRLAWSPSGSSTICIVILP